MKRRIDALALRSRVPRAAALVWLALPAQATDWYVDAHAANCGAGNGTPALPFCSIQQAIGAAADGDTIHIARGAYAETLLIRKDLSLIGTEGEALTVLNGQGLGGNGITIEDGHEVAIDGLTVKNAQGTGIRVSASQPASELVLTNSTVSRSGSSGILNANGTLSLVGVDIRDNTAYGQGGGIRNQAGAITVQGSRIEGNRSQALFGTYGGGVYSTGSLTVADSTIANNTVVNVGRAFHLALGGGVSNGPGGIALIRNSSLSGNSVTIPNAYTGSTAGGAALENRGRMTVENTLVTGSYAWPNQYDEGIAIECSDGTLTLRSSTIIGGNTRIYRGSCVRATGSSMIADSIVWGGPAAYTGSFIDGSVGQPLVHHSDVQNGWTGPGSFNLTVDPEFTDPANGDYTLRASSGLIDRGDPDTGLLGTDLAGRSRLNDGDLDRRLVIDMGAFEHSHVDLAVSGDAVPGGTLTVEVSGTAGMDLLLAIGTPDPGRRRDPFGILFFDLGAPVKVVSFGTIPNTTQLTIPPTVMGPVSVVMQLLALDAPPTEGTRVGNVSNPVFLTVP